MSKNIYVYHSGKEEPKNVDESEKLRVLSTIYITLIWVQFFSCLLLI